LAVYTEARLTREQTSTLESPAGAKLLASIGIVHRERMDQDNLEKGKENLEKGKEVLEKARQIFEVTDTLDTPMGAKTMWTLGDVYAGTGSWDQAWSAYERARLIHEKCKKKEKPDLIKDLEKARSRLSSSRSGGGSAWPRPMSASRS